MDLNELTIFEAHQGLMDKKFTSVELTQECLDRIKKKDTELHAFLTVTSEEALAQAQRVDEQIALGERLDMLAGIPMSVKDVILAKGVRATGGSKILENYIAPYDATVVEWLKDAGAVIVGKTNCDEFAMGSSTENSAYGPSKNPWDTTRVPGGSSGGSAVAVAAGESFYALGSDTGGSIRQPAAFCGIVGLKPSYGRISRAGLMAMASSLDQIGPFAKTAQDAALVFASIAGNDEKDASSGSSEEVTFGQLDINGSIKGLRVGLPKEYFGEGLDPRIEQSVREAVLVLKKKGCEIKDISLPYLKYALAVYYIIQPSEVSANMARFDGIRYGGSQIRNSKFEIRNLMELYLENRSLGLGAEVKRRIMLGTYSLSAGYAEAYYKKAVDVRSVIKQQFVDAFKEVDILVGPTTPTTAFKLGDKTEDPLAMYLADIYTVAQNIAGVPAISLPCGLVDNLPVGLQIIGKWWDEACILRAAHQYEQERGLFPMPA